MEDIADDRDLQPFDPSELLLDRVEVEDGLLRVLVLTVAVVHDVSVRVQRDEVRRPDLLVADDDDIGVVAADRERRVLQRLPFVYRRAGRLDRHHVGGKALGGKLEARGRPRGGLVEEIDDGAAAESRQLLHLALERAGKGPREREQPLDVPALEVRNRDQVAASRPVWRQELVTDQWVDVSHGSTFLVRNEEHGIDLVDLDELHAHVLALRGRQVLADVVGSDRKLAMAAVDQDGELDTGRAAVLEERVDRGADRAARVEHVVDEDTRLSL